MKRCPRCGLVHPDSEHICRRCRVDLSTGEKAQLPTIKTRTGFSFNFPVLEFSQIFLKIPQILEKLYSFPEKSREKEKVFYCLECGGELELKKQELYPKKFSYPFLALAVILFGLSWLVPALLITGILSLAGFFLYHSVLKKSFWQCPECGTRKAE